MIWDRGERFVHPSSYRKSDYLSWIYLPNFMWIFGSLYLPLRKQLPVFISSPCSIFHTLKLPKIFSFHSSSFYSTSLCTACYLCMDAPALNLHTLKSFSASRTLRFHTFCQSFLVVIAKVCSVPQFFWTRILCNYSFNFLHNIYHSWKMY
jgi:hypothetical protein